MDFDDPHLDFVGLANAMGVAAERVEDPADLSQAFETAFNNPGPNLIDVVVEGGI